MLTHWIAKIKIALLEAKLTYWGPLTQHQQRWVSAVCMIALFTFCVWMGGLMIALLALIIALVSYREWLGLVQTVWSSVIEYTAYTGIGIAIILTKFLGFDMGVFALFITFMAQLALSFLYSDKGDQSAPLWIAGGIFYIGLPALTIVWLREEAIISLEKPEATLMVILFIIVWATDSFAYWVGRKYGKTKLAPTISPGKTREGLLGGVIGAAVCALIIAVALGLPYALLYLPLGAFVGAVSQAGDLFESWVKRRAGVKDSGQIIPGHGGLLDRIDGLLFAAPVYALLVKPFIF